MKPTLVTGVTGFLGWHVAQQLLAAGHNVRALMRPGRAVPDLDVEPAIGDLRDPDSLVRAVAGCDQLYHVAADYRLWAKDPNELYRSNVDGTRNLLTAARKAGVTRTVYTSTVGCIGIPSEGLGSEETPVSEADMTGAYKISKWRAELVALEFAKSGFPVVIVNPTAPIGAHDVKPTPTGKIVLDFLKGAMPAFIDTGLNVVHVEDCASGHLLAGERGKSGERYILGSENLTLRQILESLAAASHRPAPRIRIPYAVAWVAGVASTGWANLSGSEPRAPLDAVRMSKKKMWVSHAKATRELGFQPGPAAAALLDAVDWFTANGYLTRDRAAS